ncbi:MAG: hypothetical protein ACI3YK_05105 [Eubacteriales bacterium]
MKNWKTICRKCLFPPLWLILILTVISATALVVVFIKDWSHSPFAPAIYVLAFYSLTVICLACWKTFPGYYKSIKGKVNENKYANRYLTDVAFKTHVSLYLSLFINLLYVATNAISAIRYSTSWFAIFAGYYAIMAIMRFLLVRYVNRNGLRNNRMGELKRARACAFILITVNLALSGAVLMMVYFNRGFEYRGFLIYVMAMYAFWVTTTAIIDLIKYRKYNSPVMSTSKVIKLAAAMVSMLSLETAMFSQFGGDSSPQMQKTMIMATGGGIAVIVAAMSLYMIIRSTVEIKKLKAADSQV